MSRRRRTEGEVAGDREAQRAAATLGSDLKRRRGRRHLTQQQMSDRLGISRTRYSGIERGEGASAPLSVWFRAGVVLGTPFAVSFSRDTVAPLVDAGHALPRSSSFAWREHTVATGRSNCRLGRLVMAARSMWGSATTDTGC
jgi:DNA-binding XRE family transcriptional regulator